KYSLLLYICQLSLSSFISFSGSHRHLHSFPTRRSSDLICRGCQHAGKHYPFAKILTFAIPFAGTRWPTGFTGTPCRYQRVVRHRRRGHGRGIGQKSIVKLTHYGTEPHQPWIVVKPAMPVLLEVVTRKAWRRRQDSQASASRKAQRDGPGQNHHQVSLFDQTRNA